MRTRQPPQWPAAFWEHPATRFLPVAIFVGINVSAVAAYISFLLRRAPVGLAAARPLGRIGYWGTALIGLWLWNSSLAPFPQAMLLLVAGWGIAMGILSEYTPSLGATAAARIVLAISAASQAAAIFLGLLERRRCRQGRREQG